MSVGEQVQAELKKFFVREDFIRWWAEIFAEAMKQHTAAIEWLERREIKLDSARDAGVISNIPPFGHESGNYVKVISLDGTATLRLDTQGDEEFDLAQQTELKLLYHQLFITNTAQADRTLVLSLGRGDFGFPESPQKREQKIIIAATTTPLSTGRSFSHLYVPSGISTFSGSHPASWIEIDITRIIATIARMKIKTPPMK